MRSAKLFAASCPLIPVPFPLLSLRLSASAGEPTAMDPAREEHLPGAKPSAVPCFLPLPLRVSVRTAAFSSSRRARRMPQALFKGEVFQHGLFEGLPRGVAVGGAAHGTLDDAGVGRTEAVAGGDDADRAQVGKLVAEEPGADVGFRQPRDPDGAEGVDGIE